MAAAPDNLLLPDGWPGILSLLPPAASGQHAAAPGPLTRVPSSYLPCSPPILHHPDSSRSSYVMQDDLLSPHQTVEETLTFAAKVGGQGGSSRAGGAGGGWRAGA